MRASSLLLRRGKTPPPSRRLPSTTTAVEAALKTSLPASTTTEHLHAPASTGERSAEIWPSAVGTHEGRNRPRGRYAPSFLLSSSIGRFSSAPDRKQTAGKLQLCGSDLPTDKAAARPHMRNTLWVAPLRVRLTPSLSSRTLSTPATRTRQLNPIVDASQLAATRMSVRHVSGHTQDLSSAGAHSGRSQGVESSDVHTSFTPDGRRGKAPSTHPRAPRSPPKPNTRSSTAHGTITATSTSSFSRTSTAAAGPDPRATLAARAIRHHRQHAALPYQAAASGAEVPGCGGGPYHVQERLPAHSSHLGRVRGAGHNVRLSNFVSLPNGSANTASSRGLSAAAHSGTLPLVLTRDAVHTRARAYEPFDKLLRRYIAHGYLSNAVPRLLHHPDGPAPAVVLAAVLRHRVPPASFVAQCLLAILHIPRADRSTAGEAAFMLEQVVERLRIDPACQPLFATPSLRVLMLEATLRESLFELATELAQGMPAAWVTPAAWAALVQAAGQLKLPHSELLWRLLSIPEGQAAGHTAAVVRDASQVLTRAGESALLRRLPLMAAPPSPPSSVSAPEATAAHASQSPITLQDDSTAAAVAAASLYPASAPSSDLPLHALRMPDSVLAARACGTVAVPASSSLGSPVLTSASPASADLQDAGEDDHDASSSSTAGKSALVPSAFDADGARWCTLTRVDLGYAAEHYSSDSAATAAGDARGAAAAAGTLSAFPSFQSLQDAVAMEMRQDSGRAAPVDKAGRTDEATSASRDARRALWETTALRMLGSQQGVAYGLDATNTARLLLRCGVSFAGQASPLLAQHILRRYVRSCHLLRDQIVHAQALIEAQLDAQETSASTRTVHTSTSTATDAATQITSSSSTAMVCTHGSERRKSTLRGLYPRLARAVAPHASPFHVFFKVMREARDILPNTVAEEAAAAVNSSRNNGTASGDARSRFSRTSARGGRLGAQSLPMMHWELVWHTFQILNRENPEWYTQIPLQEAGELCQDVIEVLCHGADPWLTLNTARAVSARHLVDGVDMSLWLLHRLDPSHHTEEARDVARRLFRWLLVDVGLHLQPALHRHLIPAARALIRLNLQEELRVLYSAVLDNVYIFDNDTRDAFLEVLQDLLCPSCATILPESDVYVDRTCPNCMTVVPAKDADAMPSFRLSAEHVARVQARRRQHRQRARRRLSDSVSRLQTEQSHYHRPTDVLARSEGGETNRFGGARRLRGPYDAAEALQRHLQRNASDGGGIDMDGLALLTSTAPLIPGVSVSSGQALFPIADGRNAGAGGAVLDVRAAMEESSRRLELQRAARQYTLAQRGEMEFSSDDREGRSRAGRRSTALTHSATAMLPTSIPISAQALDAATLKYLTTTTAAGSGAAHRAPDDAMWVCVWCQEKNNEWNSRVQCSACGAETGPAAPWRHFAYADPVTGDVMSELRGRIGNCEDRPVDAVVAGYLLMVYRRTFQLRATPADLERLQRLIAMLCQLQERVLAGYVYTRLIPPSMRQRGELLHLLAQTYGQEHGATYLTLTSDDLTRPEREAVFFSAVFGQETCRVCFGTHDWHRCPIVTRDFASAAAAAATSGATGATASESGETGAAHAHRRSAISMSPEEKQQAVLERLAQRITQAVQSITASAASESTTATLSIRQGQPLLLPPGKPDARLVVDAYTCFVSSPFREVFAELHPTEANRLSLLLSCVHQYRRAAFVLCHIPLQMRATEAYRRLVHYFNITEEEALQLLEKPTDTAAVASTVDAPGAETPSTTTTSVPSTESVPNFVQVTQTCCMCLDERHASHACPRLAEWLTGVERLATMASVRAEQEAQATSGSKVVSDVAGESRLRLRLRAQVDGWTTAGPERLHAFYRYLVAHVDRLLPNAPSNTVGKSSDRITNHGSSAHGQYRVDGKDVLLYAVNKTIEKLTLVAQRNAAYRLYAHTPVESVYTATTAALLRMNGFSEDGIRALLQQQSSSTTDENINLQEAGLLSGVSYGGNGQLHAPLAARTAAVPMQQCCLFCFSPDHAFVDCAELAARALTEGDRLQLVLKDVGGIRCTADGINAAAAYVYGMYNSGRLSSEMLRGSPSLVVAMLQLAHRCFAVRQLRAGVRVLRRVPVEMVPPTSAYADLWHAAGLSDDAVEAKQAKLLSLLDTAGLVPCIDPPPPRPTYSNAFLSQLARTLHDDLCRHCYEHGHTIATCPLFHAEVSFGRDYVAAYRMSMMSEQLDRAWQEAYLLKLVDFFHAHYLFMPYHIAGVANALNAITAMWSFRGEPGIALYHLLRIPPAYRRRQAFKHVLHALRVPPVAITKLLGDLHFSNDATRSPAAQTGVAGMPQQQQETVMAQHLLMPKPAIRDTARRQIVEQVPAAQTAYEESAARMAAIRERHARGGSSSDDRVFNSGGSLTASVSAGVRTSVPLRLSGNAAASFDAPGLRRVMQSGDILQLREDFDPILSELEDAVGMRLGSRHTLFTSAMEIVSAAAASAAVPPPSSPSQPSAPSSSAGVHQRQQQHRRSGRADAAPLMDVRDAEVVTEVRTRPATTPTTLPLPQTPPSPRDRQRAPVASSGTAASGRNDDEVRSSFPQTPRSTKPSSSAASSSSSSYRDRVQRQRKYRGDHSRIPRQDGEQRSNSNSGSGNGNRRL